MYRVLYNLSIALFVGLLYVVQFFNAKVRKMIVGRRNQHYSTTLSYTKTICVHCASLGEFEQGRSLIEALRVHNPKARLVLTFFSASGYEIRKNYDGVDAVYYLPFDRPRKVKKFVRELGAEEFYIIKYEYWYNLLKELNRSGCKIYLVSAIFRENSTFFRSSMRGGAFYRAMLGYFTTIFVQDNNSKELLESIGCADSVVVAGDTRFDRVAQVTKSAKQIAIVEDFVRGSELTIVCGSTWGADEELLCEVMKMKEDWKFVVVPHEISQGGVERLIENSGRVATKYSEGVLRDGSTLFVVDTIGLLSSLYQYGELAYIGGGFGVGIHNTLEAATWGVPIVFGPKYEKFREARELIAAGAARSISSADELLAAFENFAAEQKVVGAKAKTYVEHNIGATSKIISSIYN